MAKFLTDRHEIAMAMNFGKYPVLTIDMTNHGGFDNERYCVGCDVRCEYETARFGKMYTEGHIYVEDGKFGISNNSACLKDSFGYSDIKDMAHWANTPIVKANQEVVVVYDMKDVKHCIVAIMKTSAKVDPHCMVALTLEHID